MTIKDKIKFNFDGVWSDTLGLISVNTDGGMFEEIFVADRNIVETEVLGSDRPIFHRLENAPIEFDLTIAFEDGFDDDKIDYIVRWLFSDYYKPLYFEGREDRVYKCIVSGGSSLIHNGLKEGYFVVTVRCDSAKIYSPIHLSDKITSTSESNLTIFNDGHYDSYPEISIKKIGDGDVEIINNSDGGDIFKIINLTDGEDIYIDCERELIETDAIGIYRYENVVGLFTRLIEGNNEIKIIGNCEIQFRYTFKYKF